MEEFFMLANISKASYETKRDDRYKEEQSGTQGESFLSYILGIADFINALAFWGP
jgi:hypothetical protein